MSGFDVKITGTVHFDSPEAYQQVKDGMSKHPIDALKDLGMPMTPESESRMRTICDELSGPRR